MGGEGVRQGGDRLSTGGVRQGTGGVTQWAEEAEQKVVPCGLSLG